MSGSRDPIPLVEPSPPRFLGGNTIVTVDEYKYMRSLDEHKHSVIGRLVLSKGDQPIKANFF